MLCSRNIPSPGLHSIVFQIRPCRHDNLGFFFPFLDCRVFHYTTQPQPVGFWAHGLFPGVVLVSCGHPLRHEQGSSGKPSGSGAARSRDVRRLGLPDKLNQLRVNTPQPGRVLLPVAIEPFSRTFPPTYIPTSCAGEAGVLGDPSAVGALPPVSSPASLGRVWIGTARFSCARGSAP